MIQDMQASRGHGGKLATGVGWHTAFILAVFEQIAVITEALIAMTSETSFIERSVPCEKR